MTCRHCLTEIVDGDCKCWFANPGPQSRFLNATEFEVLLGGARGGGKSEAALVDSTDGLEHERYAGIAFRESYPELEQLIERSFKFYKGKRRGSWNGTSRTWRFPSGASIKFRHLGDAGAWRKYLGHEYQWMLFEELTSFAEHQYLMLMGSCRSSVPGLRPRLRSTTNPGGPGHNWVRARFVDVAPPGTVYRDPETGLSRLFIPSRVSDTPQIAQHDPDYIKRLMLLPEADRRAMLEGDWDAYTGSVFRLEKGIHTIDWAELKRRTGEDGIPADWTRYRVMDWGYSHPFSIHWIAVDFDGVAYVYREWYGVSHKASGGIQPNTGVSLQPTLVAERIKLIEADDRVSLAWTGPDLNSAGTGDTSAGIKRIEYFERQGVFFDYWTAGTGSRKAKKTALEERLYHSDQQKPGIVFLTGRRPYEQGKRPAALDLPKGWGEIHDGAPHAIRTIPALEYDKARGGEDIDSDGEDHAYDSVSAFCLMRPWAPIKPEPEIARMIRERKEEGGSWMSD